MNSIYKIVLFGTFLVLAVPGHVLAHPGRTAADGCHYCRTNCAKWGETTGERHCHGGSVSVNEEKVSPAPAPVSKRSLDDILAERTISSLAEYRANHSGFRERFIEQLLTERNSTNNTQMRTKVADLVYRLLPDVK